MNDISKIMRELIHSYDTALFKIAFRNILKYRTQSIISIIGLAVGFTCFALANLWIHYDTTYDAYHEGADRMYILCKENIFGTSGYSTYMPYPASTVLKNDFSEVEAACAYTRWTKATDIKVDGQPAVEVHEMQADSCFMNMFGISILSGNMDFMYSDDKIALTEDVAMRLFGTTDVLGKEVKTTMMTLKLFVLFFQTFITAICHLALGARASTSAAGRMNGGMEVLR